MKGGFHLKTEIIAIANQKNHPLGTIPSKSKKYRKNMEYGCGVFMLIVGPRQNGVIVLVLPS